MFEEDLTKALSPVDLLMEKRFVEITQAARDYRAYLVGRKLSRIAQERARKKREEKEKGKK